MDNKQQDELGQMIGKVLSHTGVQIKYPFEASLLETIAEICAYIDANFISKYALISMTKDCEHDSSSHCLEMDCYVHEKGGYNEAIRDVVSLINKQS